MIGGKPEKGDVFKYDVSVGKFILQFSPLPGECNFILLNEVEGFITGRRYAAVIERVCKKENLLIGRYV